TRQPEQAALPWWTRWRRRSPRGFRSEPAYDHRAVGAAEAERVRQCDINLHVAGGVRAVVEIALGILREDIDGRRRNLVMHRQRCEYGLDTACRTEQVTRHGLGRVHHQLVGMIAHRKLKGHGFVAV